MRKIFFYIMILQFFLFGSATSHAQENFLTFDLAKNHVDINTGFHGTYLQIFGVREAEGDIAIIIEGPRKNMNVRLKEKILGAWLNKSHETFQQVPSFYVYALSKPLENLASPGKLDEYRIGTDHINLKVETEELDVKKLRLFRNALIRNKQAQGLFASHAEEIIFLSQNFFRTQFYIPANVPVGEYTVKSLYLQDGEVKEVKTSTLKVAQVGLSAKVFKFAHRKRFLYGLLCILLALFAGWFSNRVRLKG